MVTPWISIRGFFLLFVRIKHVYLLKLKIMNKNYLLEILSGYLTELNNNDFDNEELSIVIENIMCDLKDLDRNLN
jgi:hypothetical protein